MEGIMLILHAKNIIKYYGDRLIINVPDFKIYEGDRIGLIGTNGCGKSTLLDILTGKIEADSGVVNINSTFAYVTQLDCEEIDAYRSGGEVTKTKIFNAVSGQPGLLIADEPTANLDVNAILKTEQIFKNIKGALLIVSHDRSFLDSQCNKIIKLENGQLKEYPGNYSGYEEQSELEHASAASEYEKYITKKKHLQNAVSGMSKAEGRIKKTPSRMGNSEARLHKRSSTEIKKHLAQHRKGIQSRLDKLEEKEKPRGSAMPRIYHQGVNLPISSSAVSLNIEILKAGEKQLLEKVKLVIPTGSKMALTGSNGSGKTTLLKHIWDGGAGVKIAPGSRAAYFSQKLDNLDDNLSLLENITKESTINQSIIRTVLASMLFSKMDILKKVSVLSGGERVKLQLAKVLLSGADFLILDEVTNFLDILAIKALEKLMHEFPGTILFVSHDRRLVDETADTVYEIRDRGIIDTTYEKQVADSTDADEVLLDMKIAEIATLLGRGDISEERLVEIKVEYDKLVSLKMSLPRG